jgi:hypothetical protein
VACLLDVPFGVFHGGDAGLAIEVTVWFVAFRGGVEVGDGDTDAFEGCSYGSHQVAILRSGGRLRPQFWVGQSGQMQIGSPFCGMVQAVQGQMHTP